MAGQTSRLMQSRKLAELERVRLGTAGMARAACLLKREQADRMHREAEARSDLQHAKGLARLRSLYDDLPGRMLSPSALANLRHEEGTWRASLAALAAATETAATKLHAANAALTAAEATLSGILARSRRRDAMAQRLADEDRRARALADDLLAQDGLSS